VGSGKTKGAGCFAKIKWQQLREFIKEDQDILVSRVWLRSVGALTPKRRSKKKVPPTPPPQNNPVARANSAKHLKSDQNITYDQAPEPALGKAVEDDYDPPPLFASIGEIKKY